MRIIRTTFLLGALTLFLMLMGQYFGGRNGLTLGLGIAVCTNAFAYFFSDKIALLSSGARPVSREQLPRLYAVMERLAAKANLPVPKLYLIPEAAPNAFATGRNPRHASVAVTEGLLELMNDDELEGVIAHELSHVRNYDILISSIAATLAGAIMWIPRFGYWFGIGDRDDRERGGGSGILGLLLIILAPLGAFLLQLALSRQREFSADETGARMVGQPYGLIKCAPKARGLQPTNTHDLAFPVDLGIVHRKAHVRRRHLFVFVQHPSPAREANPGSAGDDRNPAALTMF